MIRIHVKEGKGRGILGLLSGALVAFALSLAPANAQEAAFDQPQMNPAFVGGAGSMPGRPISTSATATENKSNLKHWSTFSHGSTKSIFRRVPAGTATGSGKLHYSRPQCVAPGQTTASKQNGGMVKRYLAYNVPAGHYMKKSTAPTASVSTSSSTAAPAKKASSNKIPVLSYSKHSGVSIVTGHVTRSHHASAGTVAFYSSYH
ncbi:MAG: hypothetical protein K2X77_32995 [Candidatus Obscuribacterales bacterium]|nr:hypothetical protein [Candidatus Obscuribacterales bacterium]